MNILNEDMDDIIRILKSLKHSNVISDGGSQTVKDETKIQEDGFLLCVIKNFGCFSVRKYLD